MRNWNPSGDTRPTSSPSCFQPTYEELKPIICEAMPVTAFVFSLPMRWNKTVPLLILDDLGVFSLPMRNWNQTVPLLILDDLGVFSLPMRNWNPFIRSLPIGTQLFSAYLWGIETLQWNPQLPPNQQVFSLPMRNWNWCVNLCPRLRPRVFSLPMRNWNSALSMMSPNRFRGFSAYLWGIETTLVWDIAGYPKKVFSLPMRNWNWLGRASGSNHPRRFQPTYEELKRYMWKYMEAVGGVFSLPMRNWNSAACIRSSSSLPFSAYLWGIETHHPFLPSSSGQMFSAYLWGIETTNDSRHKKENGVFSLPMRNWNHGSRDMKREKFMVFSLPEELKHVMPEDIKGEELRFSAYLWGIETCNAWRY